MEKRKMHGKRLFIPQPTKKNSNSPEAIPEVKTNESIVDTSIEEIVTTPTAIVSGRKSPIIDRTPKSIVKNPMSNPVEEVPPPSPVPETPKKKRRTQKAVVPKSRIVVVRTTSATKEEAGKIKEASEAEKSVDIPAAITDGRTSVYLIRRPIPPPEPRKPTILFEPPEGELIKKKKKSPPEKHSQNGSNRSDRPVSSPAANYDDDYDEDNRSSRSRAISSSSNRRKTSPHAESQRTNRNRNSRVQPAAENDDLETNEKQPRVAAYLRPKPTPVKKNVQPSKSVEKPSQSVVRHHVHELKRPESEEEISMSDEVDDEFTNCSTCLLCLSKNICLVIVLCTIMFLIGLAGTAVSIYFLAAAANSQTAAKIIGIVFGIFVAIGALIFLFVVLTCVGSCEAYFSFRGDGSRRSGKKSSTGRLSNQKNYRELKETSPTSRLSSPVDEIIPTVPDGKNITIEMPARLITGRSTSPKSQQKTLNKVVNNIGQVVQDANKRYPGDLPDKVIVQVDPDDK